MRIVESRLQHFLQPFADLDLVRKQRQSDALFPLGEAWREQFFRDRTDIRPRNALNWAREGWRQRQEALARHDPHDWLTRWPKDGDAGPGLPDETTTEEIREAIDGKIAEKLTANREQLDREPHTLPADADHLAGVVRSLLDRSAAMTGIATASGKWSACAPPKNARPTYHLSLRQRDSGASADTRTGVLFLMERSPTSVAGFLRRLLAGWNSFDRVVLVTQEQVGLPLGQAGNDYLDDLRQHGPQRFQTLELTFAEQVELEALQRVVGLAKSGNLEIEPRPGQVARSRSKK